MLNVLSMSSVVVADTQQVTAELPDGDVVVLSLSEGVYYGLNEVGARIWHLIQKPMTVGEIQAVLLDEFDVEENQCTQDIFNLLQDLATRGLVHLDPQSSNGREA